MTVVGKEGTDAIGCKRSVFILITNENASVLGCNPQMAVVVIINGRNVYVLKLLGQWICYPFVFFQRVAEWPLYGSVCRIDPQSHPTVKIQMMIPGYI